MQPPWMPFVVSPERSSREQRQIEQPDNQKRYRTVTVVCGRRRKCGRMRVKEAGKKMTKRLEVAPAPAPLEEYTKHFDGLFGKSNKREGFRRYVEGLLLPSERPKTLTGLTNTGPVVGAQLARAQRRQGCL